jgi:GTPase SAR1 family protein
MKAQVMKIMMTLNPLIEATQSTYKSLEPFKEMGSLAGSEMYFKQITKLNKEVNGKFQELIKYLNGVGVPAKEKAELYGHILEFYANQNKEYTKLYKEVGVLPEFTQRAQNYVNRLMEKYMKDIKF